jgi:hypothetical protein
MVRFFAFSFCFKKKSPHAEELMLFLLVVALALECGSASADPTPPDFPLSFALNFTSTVFQLNQVGNGTLYYSFQETPTETVRILLFLKGWLLLFFFFFFFRIPLGRRLRMSFVRQEIRLRPASTSFWTLAATNNSFGLFSPIFAAWLFPWVQ